MDVRDLKTPPKLEGHFPGGQLSGQNVAVV